MVKKFIIVLLAIGMLIFYSCKTSSSTSSDPEHHLRITNNSGENILEVVIGSVNYGDINNGDTTDYEPIDNGTSEISFRSQSGTSYTGSVTVTGEGTHFWTLTIHPGGNSSMNED